MKGRILSIKIVGRSRKDRRNTTVLYESVHFACSGPIPFWHKAV